MKNQIDVNDFQFVSEKLGVPVSSLPCPQDSDTGKINPHVSQFKLLGNHEETVSVFHVKPVYYEHKDSADENLVFRPMYEVCEHYGNRLVVFKYEKLTEVHPRYIEWLRKRMKLINGQVLITSPFSEIPSPFNFAHEIVHATIVKPKVGMTVTTVYPDPHTETTTFDAYQFQTNASWSTLRASATGGTDDTSANEAAFIGEIITNYNLGRCEYLFDTSSLGSGASISSAVFSLYYQGTKTDAATTNSCNGALVSSNPASNTGVTNTDYANYGTTRYADTDVTIASLSTTTYYDWTMNATGIAAVAKTGVTKLGIRPSNDFSDSTAPTGGRSFAKFYFADQTGTSSDPKLVVTHTAGAVTVNAATQVATFSLPTYAVQTGVTISPSAQVATLSIPTYSVSVQEQVTVTPAAQVATFTIPAYSILAGDVLLNMNAQVATFSVPAYTVSAQQQVTVTPATQVATLSIPTYSVTAQISVIVSVAVQVLTFSLPTLAKVGGVWNKVARATSSTWSRTSRNDD